MTATYVSPAAELNIQCDQGATFSLIATCSNETGLMDLSGYTAQMQLRTSPTFNGGVTPSIVYSLTTSDGQITLGGTAGTITLDITAANTATIPAGEYCYDLFILSGAVAAKMLTGLFTVLPRVTIPV